MAFLSGTVSFSRLSVVGGSPKRLDQRLLDKLKNRLVGGKGAARAGDEEVGWIGGRHLLDREFDTDKNIILECLHFGMRIDGSRVPADLMYAYLQMELDSLIGSAAHDRASAADGEGNGRRQSRARLVEQARSAARDRAAQEIKQGRFRSSRQVPILWDTRDDILYVGSTQPASLERLHPLFRETFDRKLEPMTAGALAYRWAEAHGVSRRIENLGPAKLVPHPSGNGHIDVYWTSGDSASRDYLGNEFLLWLWYTLTEESDTIRLGDHDEAAVVMVKQLLLECPWAETGKELITCDGPTSLPESRRAIQTGKLPRKAGLMVSRGGEQYEFILQAESMNVTSAALPKPERNGNGHRDAPAGSAATERADVEERVAQIRDLAETLDGLFSAFLQLRLSDDWGVERESIRAWLTGL